MRSWQNNVTILGDPDSGDTELLRLALQRLDDSHLHVQVVKPAEYSAEIVMESDPLFIVLDNRQLYESKAGLLSEHKPSELMQFAWNCLEAHRPTFVVIGSDSLQSGRFTPIDTLALSLSGVAGVWELTPSLLNRSNPKLQNFQQVINYWRLNRVQLHGRSLVHGLYSFYETVTASSWPTMVETSDEKGRTTEEELQESQRRTCFKLALGIATLDTDTLSQEDKKLTLDSIASTLCGLGERTGVWMAKSVVTKHLGYLDRGWKERLAYRYDKNRRFEMPVWARLEGFSSVFPLIRHISYTDVAEQIYSALTRIDFERDWDPNEENPFTTVSIGKNR